MLIGVHMLFNMPILVSLIIPRNNYFTEAFFYFAKVQVHLFGIAEPLMLLYFDKTIKSVFK